MEGLGPGGAGEEGRRGGFGLGRELASIYSRLTLIKDENNVRI